MVAISNSIVKNKSMIVCAIVPMLLSTEAFSPARTSTRKTSVQPLKLVDPTLIAAAAGLIGTATGWGSRSAEISDLQKQNAAAAEELVIAQNALNTTKLEFEEEKEKYERALYEMDSEFEGQTDIIRAEYEKKLLKTKVNLEADYITRLKRVKSTLEEESKLKLIEQEGKLKQQFLQEKLGYQADFNSKTANDLVKALNYQSKLVSENKELKENLDQVQADLKEIMQRKKGLFG